MGKFNLHKKISICCGFTLLFLAGCVPKMVGKPVNLDLNDSRPILSVQAADADEAMLLVQKLGLEIVRLDGFTVFFFEDADQLSRMAELGYETRLQNGYDVYRRVVRIDRSVSEAGLVANGVRIINREENYLVVNATIGQLRALVRSGSNIVEVSGHEPRPRQVRIFVESMEDVEKIGAMEVDIYSAKPENYHQGEPYQGNRKAKIEIYGAAFDYQIDQLEEQGYDIEILPNPATIEKGDKS